MKKTVFNPDMGIWENYVVDDPIKLNTELPHHMISDKQRAVQLASHPKTRVSTQNKLTIINPNSGYADNFVSKSSPNRVKMIYINPSAVSIIYLSFGRPRLYAECIPLQPYEKWVDDINSTTEEVFVGCADANTSLLTLETVEI